jgi:hypothetical protein
MEAFSIAGSERHGFLHLRTRRSWSDYNKTTPENFLDFLLNEAARTLISSHQIHIKTRQTDSPRGAAQSISLQLPSTFPDRMTGALSPSSGSPPTA